MSIEYLAGLIDGEGCLLLQTSNGGSTHGIAVVVSMCGPKVHTAMLCHRPNACYTLKKTTGHQRFETVWYGPNAARLLEELLPYLILKHEQAILLLQYEYTRQWARDKFGKTAKLPTLAHIGAVAKIRCSELKAEGYVS